MYISIIQQIPNANDDTMNEKKNQNQNEASFVI